MDRQNQATNPVEIRLETTNRLETGLETTNQLEIGLAEVTADLVN